MTTPEHLRITGPEDVLGYIPHSLGFWPENSLVAMTMQGKRLGATLRVDLPGTDAPPGAGRGAGTGSHPSDYARTVASYLTADEEADGALLAFFTGESGPGESRASLLAALEAALARAGMPVRDAWYIGTDFWRNAYCNDAACCALPGRPVEEIRNSPLNAEMVFRGSAIGAAPQAPLLPSQPADPAALRVERTWARKLDGLRRDRAQFGQVLDVWMRVLHADAAQAIPPALAGYLRASLRVQVWRDAVLVMAAAGREAAERGAADFGSFDGAGLPLGGQAVPAVPLPPMPGFAPVSGDGGTRPASGQSGTPGMPGYGEILLGLAPAVPDWALMTRLGSVLDYLCADSGPEARAAGLAGRGWIEWCRGRGSFAEALFRQAGQECPGYRLAELLAELTVRGTICGWAAHREAAWQKFGPDAAGGGVEKYIPER